MVDWLSATWGANWRSFQYFNAYRLVVSVLFLGNLLFPHGWNVRLKLYASPFLLGLSLAYIAGIALGLWFSIRWKKRFNAQLSLQMLADVLFVCPVMYVAGGVASGFSVLLLVSLAAASLVGTGHLVLFYAALATLGVLVEQTLGVWEGRFDQSSIIHAGLTGAGFFATALLARLLGQRAMQNEELARRRGEALDNQIRISRRVVERVQDGVLIVHPDGRIGGSNPVARDMLGLPEGGESHLADCAPALQAALSAGPVDRSGPARFFLAPDGRELSARFEETTSSAGEILILIQDPGRIRERAQQMKLASLGRLTASIAHEIRNPLSAVSHAGELLQEEPSPEVQKRLLRILGDNIRRLDRIVGDVLQLGRQNPAWPERVELDEFCHSLAGQLTAAENLPDQTILLALGEGGYICFDRAHLYQVLANLVGNALRYCSRAAGSVRLEAVSAADEGRVELHVQDDGPGVAPAVYEQIFEPFFTTHHQGTGLGLYIARELCSANGATLELRASSSGAHFVVVGRSDTCQMPESKDARAPS